MELPQKITNRTTIDFSNFTSVYICKGNEVKIFSQYLYSSVQCSMIAKIGKQTKCLLMYKWIKKMLSIYLFTQWNIIQQ